MRFILISILALGFALGMTSCSTTPLPPFQKYDGNQGYAVREIDSRDHLMIDLTLAGGQRETFYRNYGVRAVGEECRARGFDYFNAATVYNGRYEGFCSTKQPRILGITYENAGLHRTPPDFIVESLIAKPKTFVHVGDHVTSMDGRKLTAVSDFQISTFNANKTGHLTQKLVLWRDNQSLTVDEPMIATDHSYMAPSDLAELERAF